MDVGRRRGGNGGGGVAAGSVWDHRTKLHHDAPKDDNSQEVSTKRKIWKSDSNPLQISRKRSQLYKDLSAKSPIQIKKTRSMVVQRNQNKGPDVDHIISPVYVRKMRSESAAASSKQLVPELECCEDEGNEKKDSSNLLQLVLAQAKDANFEEASNKNALEGNENEIIKPNGIPETRSEETDACEEKVITTNEDLALVKFPLKVETDNVEEEEQIEEKIEIDSIVVMKEMSVSEEHRPKQNVTEKEYNPALSENGCARFASIPTTAKRENSHSTSNPQCRLQSLVDLVMWRDASRTALMFGVGTFIIISSSYSHELKVSFISVVSYISLLYLAVVFLFRSLAQSQGIAAGEKRDYVVGEEEAIWALKRILPYVNEFLLKIRALFSGDPATTFKMAVLLFVLAKCGSSISIWKMAKLGFFGVFIVPRIGFSYSAQLNAHGKFWIGRFRDAWESCTHKKAVAFGIFTLVWNLSSLAARFWAAFMMYVVFRCYQESEAREEESDGWGKIVKPQEKTKTAKIGLKHVGGESTSIHTTKKAGQLKSK
ncbi:unnamed protein product [Cuscuta europaea]|uniref:Reticulon-like protein n=1 Tax=Cuscuta europaea TaxID=41803 RepID=A0A9P1EB74_CUSEU|nr:unnamed protein product [Cuscuta europaea]